MSDQQQVNPFDFVNRFHEETMKKRRARMNPDGTVTTVRTMGVEHGGKIFAVPGFDPDTGVDLSEDEALTRALPFIHRGEIPGLAPEEHNRLARINHLFLAGTEDEMRSAVAYKPSLLELILGGGQR